jgi:prepilin-type N-terminal cleavage/methylation domain-containing protein
VNNRSEKSGFTLVEILVAVAIIAAIVSMVYGSYFATSKSAQACSKRIALSQQGRKLLEQMAQQIRCSYAGSIKRPTPPAGKLSLKNEETQENIINYFTGGSGVMGGEILNLVTTYGIVEQKSPGLLKVTYKFDKRTGTLLFSQQSFIDAPDSLFQKKIWQLLAENIESIELAFSDGRQWLNTWDFIENKALPFAVKINITFEDENYQQCQYGTTAYICCRKNQAKKTTSAGLVSVNKQ